jgi:hypothetical protein
LNPRLTLGDVKRLLDQYEDELANLERLLPNTPRNHVKGRRRAMRKKWLLQEIPDLRRLHQIFVVPSKYPVPSFDRN